MENVNCQILIVLVVTSKQNYLVECISEPHLATRNLHFELALIYFFEISISHLATSIWQLEF